MGRFIDRVNGGDIGNGAVVVPLDADVWGEYANQTERGFLTCVVPEGARGGDGISPEDVLILAEDGRTETTYELEAPGTFQYAPTWFPNANWNPNTDWNPDANWIPSTNWIVGDPTKIGVLVPNAEATMERMGVEELPEDAEMVEQGDTVEAENIVVATFGDPELYPEGTNRGIVSEGTNENILPEEPPFPGGSQSFDDMPRTGIVFDAGVQAPLGGAGFGMGALATPSAEVGGQNANPLTAVETVDLLTRDETRGLLADAGVSDAEDFEWLAGPEAMSAEIDYETPDLLGATAELALFGGVVSGDDAPWGVTLGVARATPDDHVIAVGVNRRPVGTGESGLEAVQNDQHVIDNMTEMLAETVPNLESS